MVAVRLAATAVCLFVCLGCGLASAPLLISPEYLPTHRKTVIAYYKEQFAHLFSDLGGYFKRWRVNFSSRLFISYPISVIF